jgi:formylglycine-generating enzyme required for sulfatase activity
LYTLLLLCQGPGALQADAGARGPRLPLARVAGGSFKPLLAPRGQAEVQAVAVQSFWLMTRPVRNDEFLAFVIGHPRYLRDNIPRAFADPQYLMHFQSPTSLGPQARPHQPVTSVSWFAARAFCESHSLRLPSEAEWEWAAAASETLADARRDETFRRRILDWYARPAGELPAVPHGAKNLYGIHDLHGVVWEWVEDFNADVVIADDRSRSDSAQSRFMCGGGALLASDALDYPAFLRLGFRSSLQASYTAKSLGFRCARDDRSAKKERS